MVVDMENYKVLVNNEAESKEVQDLFFELGGDFYFGGKFHCNAHLNLVTINKDGLMANLELDGFDYVEITIPQLRDLVVLKRNSIDDASFKDVFRDVWYVDSTNSYWMFENDIWRKAEEPLFKLEPIDKEVKVKEYLVKTDSGRYLYTKNVSDIASERVIEIPEGAEIFLLDKSWGEDTLYFVKHDGDVFHEYYISGTDIQNNTWIKGTIKELHKGMGEVLWERSLTKTDTAIQDELKSINKESEVKMKEYLDTNYELRSVKQTSGDNHVPSGWIEVPDGAEIAIESLCKPYFVKLNGETYDEFFCLEWRSGCLTEQSLRKYKKILWQRNTETPNTSIQEKLKFIEKWLNGEKIQYILGDISDKSQWHNFTEGAMQYIKRSDIKFREAPKYVTIDGIEFKNIESILNYIKSNFDLEDGE